MVLCWLLAALMASPTSRPLKFTVMRQTPGGKLSVTGVTYSFNERWHPRLELFHADLNYQCRAWAWLHSKNNCCVVKVCSVECIWIHPAQHLCYCLRLAVKSCQNKTWLQTRLVKDSLDQWKDLAALHCNHSHTLELKHRFVLTITGHLDKNSPAVIKWWW